MLFMSVLPAPEKGTSPRYSTSYVERCVAGGWSRAKRGDAAPPRMSSKPLTRCSPKSVVKQLCFCKGPTEVVQVIGNTFLLFFPFLSPKRKYSIPCSDSGKCLGFLLFPASCMLRNYKVFYAVSVLTITPFPAWIKYTLLRFEHVITRDSEVAGFILSYF